MNYLAKGIEKVVSSLRKPALAGIAALAVSCAHTNAYAPGSYDKDGDGKTDYTVELIDPADESKGIIYKQFEDGKLMHQVWDRNTDGKAESQCVMEYDGKGNRTKELWDDNGDGDASRVYFWGYDAESKLIFRAHDENADGKPDIAWWWSYQEDGKLQSEVTDTDGDGVPNVVRGWLYSPDGEDYLEILDEDADGRPDKMRDGEGDWVDIK
ncbi:MAG: hypothetical protein V1729_05245 [Candidatus Woesearchaeota archaeon]